MEPTKMEGTKKGQASFFSYLFGEMTHGHFMSKNDARYNERRERVYIFLKQPREIEKMMVYGTLLCLDVFLYVFTFLPWRILFAIFQIIIAPYHMIQRRAILHPALSCDLLKGIIFICCTFLMSYIDTSFIYHLVRAQTLIKLYIIFNMLEVADRLFSSFGQDILDALFFTATEFTFQRGQCVLMVLHLALAVFYVFIHATLVLFQATTLNVALNSHNTALLTIMMSNNFVEIKGTVFKKYDKNNLFQISCSDVRERFHNFALMLVVLLRNMQQYQWDYESFMGLMPSILAVVFSEYAIDWFKHAFVMKFNHIPLQSYREYRATLAYDVASSRRNSSTSDHSDVVSRRLGFIPLPLAVLLFYITRITIDFNGAAGVLVIFFGYIILLLVKVLNNIFIVGKALKYISEDLTEATKPSTTSNNGHTMAIIDPFEQRGSRSILLSTVKRPPIHRGDVEPAPVVSNKTVVDALSSSNAAFATPAKVRSMRQPSVDNIVTAGTNLGTKRSPTFSPIREQDEAFQPITEDESEVVGGATTAAIRVRTITESTLPSGDENNDFPFLASNNSPTPSNDIVFTETTSTTDVPAEGTSTYLRKTYEQTDNS